ncbi:MAG: recombinase family protein [Oscillospiraceae bacterium]
MSETYEPLISIGTFTHDSIEIIDVFADEAISGMKNKRPELDRFFIALPLKLFDCVLIYDQSRFSRDIVDWFTFRRAVQNNGVKFISTTQNIVGGDLNDPSVFATEGINALVNQLHVLQTRQKVVEKMNFMARQGLHAGGRPALGYDIIDKHFVINESEAKIVKLIFTSYSLGYSYSEIIDILNQKGLRTKRGQSFGKNSLSDLLRNEKYIGVYIYNKVPPKINGKRNNHAKNDNPIRIENSLPPIITKGLWDTVQKRLKNNKNNAKNTAKHEYILSGKVFCGKCKMSMVGTRSKGDYFYYSCSGKRRLRNCNKKSVSQELLENISINFVRSTLVSQEDRKNIAQKIFDQQMMMHSEILPTSTIIQEQMRELSAKIENINVAISNGVYSSSTVEMLSKLEKEHRDLYTRLLEAEKMKTTTKMTYEYIFSVLSTNLNNKQNDIEIKKSLSSFIDKIYIYDDNIEIIMNSQGIDSDSGVNLPLTKGD